MYRIKGLGLRLQPVSIYNTLREQLAYLKRKFSLTERNNMRRRLCVAWLPPPVNPHSKRRISFFQPAPKIVRKELLLVNKIKKTCLTFRSRDKLWEAGHVHLLGDDQFKTMLWLGFYGVIFQRNSHWTSLNWLRESPSPWTIDHLYVCWSMYPLNTTQAPWKSLATRWRLNKPNSYCSDIW